MGFTLHVAILVIDMLNDFVYGSLKCDNALKIIPRVKILIDTAREHGIPVIYVNDSHLPNIDGEFKKWGSHAIKGSWGAMIIDDLKPSERDFIIEKRRYSGFYGTSLDDLLRELKIDTLIVTGIHTHICVMNTVADAFYRGYKVIIPSDCVTTFNEEDHNWGLKYMKEIYGVEITSSNDILTRLGRL
ncbi:MAG: isochorismatase family cysteine hydrolase [Candidatus Methanomethylicia archaeon]